MTAALLRDEDPSLPTAQAIGARLPGRCHGCNQPRRLTADNLCVTCDLRAAEAEACRSELIRYDRAEELHGEARALLGKASQMLEDEVARANPSPRRIAALREAEIHGREMVLALHKAVGA